MIIIKVNQVPLSKDGLKERVQRAWRINPDRLYNQEQLIAVYKGEILEVYKVNGYKWDEEHQGRIAFELEEVSSDLKGKKIIYKTANPCTIVSNNELVFA